MSEMGKYADQNEHDRVKQELGAMQMHVEELRLAMRQALHMGVGGEYTEAARVLLTALMGAPFKVADVMAMMEKDT
jgi:hypothetical protein